jgi:hypothetical protein
LKSEEKMKIAVDMTDVCVRVCADAVKDQGLTVSEEEFVKRVRERVTYRKRYRREV